VDVTTVKVSNILVTWCATMKYTPTVLSPVTDNYDRSSPSLGARN